MSSTRLPRRSPAAVRTPGRVTLNRALSKLGIMSRVEARRAIREGRVTVDGRTVRDAAHLVMPERARIKVDGRTTTRVAWRTILFHKPRGIVTTRRDPDGRKTVFDVLGDDAHGLHAVGRLDRASSGLLILTTDTQLASRLADPARAVPRVYLVTVRGEVTEDERRRLEEGLEHAGERLQAATAVVRKASRRESHLTVELREGKNREIRRMFEAAGHEVTRLKRIRFGDFELGQLAPGAWREVTRDEIERSAFSRDSSVRP